MRTDEFTNNCTVESEEEFCRTGYLTIAAEFYDGLPECGCNPEGKCRLVTGYWVKMLLGYYVTKFPDNSYWKAW